MGFEALEKIGTRECRKFAARIFERHSGVDKYLKAAYIRRARDAGYVQANNMLREVNKVLGVAGTVGKAGGMLFSASMDDDAIVDLAKTRAKKAKEIAATAGDLRETVLQVHEYVASCGVAFPLEGKKLSDAMSVADDIPQARQALLAAVNRVVDAAWWRRKLRKTYGRQVESALRSMGSVREGRSPYVSNWMLARWRESQGRNERTLGNMEAVREDGETVPLLDCIKSSVSNPLNRRNELMVRIRGFEEVAVDLGLVGIFCTLTCPSKFHAQLSAGGYNRKFEGATPIDCMEHLNGVWAKVRAKWKRAGIKAFGFRVAEPNHDGTPHFHLLLFIHPEEQKKACEIFRRYALEVDGDEKGADIHRFTVIAMDPSKGSAAGYIAKYISKNIDGYGVGLDEEGGTSGDEGAARARAWASIWGIRQFQQIGNVSVTVWRELRRKREVFDDMDLQELEKLRAAANDGEWKTFVELMGGPFVSREDQAAKPLYHESEGTPTKYGDELKRLIGIWLNPVVKRAIARRAYITREHVWQIRHRVSRCEQVAAQPPPLDLCQ